MYYVGVDIGGTNIAVGILSESGEIIAHTSVKTLASLGEDSIISRCADAVLGLIKSTKINSDEIESVGVGSPGLIDSKSGRVISASNLGFKDTALAEKLGKYLPYKIYLENDANCAALAEAFVGAAKNKESSVTVTLGTGIGCGVVINGALYTGFNGLAGEIGHIIVSDGGEPCSCGRCGCLEAYASATALTRDAKRAAEKSPLIAELAEKNVGEWARAAFEAAEQGDPVAKELIDRYVHFLSLGISSVVKLLQPEMVVIAGGVACAGDALIKPLTERVMSLAYSAGVPGEWRTVIRAAEIRALSGVIGAAMLCKNNMR